jgi:hypothetical protein
MTQESLNDYSAVIPPAGCSSTVNFYFSARQSSGERVYYPDTTHPFSPEVASEVFASFEDDFETDLAWTVYGDAADGHWIRGVPAGSGVRGDPQHDFDGSGSCYLTGNADGDSDVDAGTTNLVSPLIDLGEGDAKISYARWFSNSAGENPNSDVMNVWISSDSGDSWVQVEQVGPIEQADGNWYLRSFWVSDFVAPTSRMLLRFEVSDLGDESVVEAAVDAISINRFDCADWLCGDLTNDGRVTLADITLLIGHVYLGGPPPVPLVAGNVDASADGKITLSDVTTLIDHVYISHNPLNCL